MMYSEMKHNFKLKSSAMQYGLRISAFEFCKTFYVIMNFIKRAKQKEHNNKTTVFFL